MKRLPALHVMSVTLLAAAGCASVPASQIGQTAGTIIGAAVAPGVGAPVGAAIGMLGGMLVQGRIDQHVETRERRELADQLGQPASAGAPGASAQFQGQAVRVWVDETVVNGRIVPAHFDVQHLHSSS